MASGTMNNLKKIERVSVTGDGSKSYTQCLNELFALVDYEKLNYKSLCVLSGQVFPCTSITSTRYIFGAGSISFGNTNFIFQAVDLESTESKFRHLTVAPTSNTATDYTTQVFPNGAVVEIIY